MRINKLLLSCLLLLFFLPLIAQATPYFKKNRGLGSSGAEVLKIQEFLSEEGLYSGPISGNYFSLTLRAVKRFQKRENLKQTGRWDKVTRSVADRIFEEQMALSDEEEDLRLPTKNQRKQVSPIAKPDASKSLIRSPDPISQIPTEPSKNYFSTTTIPIPQNLTPIPTSTPPIYTQPIPTPIPYPQNIIYSPPAPSPAPQSVVQTPPSSIATTTATTTPAPPVPPPPSPTITVTSPNGGEEWIKGTTYGITWTSTNLSNIYILQIILLKDGIPVSTLATVENTGSWTWAIPGSSDFSSGTVYQIKIVSSTDQNIFDNSNAGFAIAPLPITGPDTSLIGHWKFDGNGNNEIAGGPGAAIIGGASFKNDGGRLGGYLYIPTASDSAKIPYNSQFDLPNAFTIAFWFRQRSEQSFLQDLVYKGNGLNNYNFRIFRQLWNEYNFGPIITGYTSNTNGWWTQTSNPNQLTHNAWHHVAFVKDPTWRAYYLDGILIHSVSNDSPPAKTPATDIIIGDSAVDTDIDDLKIYNRALIGSEVVRESSRY